MIINGTPEDDSNLIGTAEDDTITGLTGDDIIDAGLGDDSIEGGAGDDTITFGAGAKFVDGQEGEDLLELDFSTEDADFDLIYNSTDGGITDEGPLANTRIEGIEQVNVSSGGGNDMINISGASVGSTVNLGTGNNMVIGSTGADVLTGGQGDDTITAGQGDDTLFGGAGTDILNGQDGDDLIAFGAGTKTIDGGGGNDRLFLDFSDGTEDLILTYDEFEGPSLTEGGILDGTSIESIERVDLFSGAGNDVINVGFTSIGSVIFSGAGDDAVIGGRGNDSLSGEAGNNTFFGNDGADFITGGAGNDAAVFLGPGSNYEVVIGDGVATVTGSAPPFIPEGETEPLEGFEPEVFTDNLSGIEIILFENGEVNTATGEFVPLPDAPEAVAEQVPVITQDPALELVEAPPEIPETPEGPEGVDIDVDLEADDGTVRIFEFLNTDTQTQFYTTTNIERDTILENLPQYEPEGISFVGVEPPAEGEDITGITPIYRFFNTISGVHLYTAEEQERAFVEENLDNLVFEGTPYYGFETQEEGTVPLYRFLNESLGAQFYTVSEEERAAFEASPDFVAEGDDGIAFYVNPAPEI